MFSLIGMLWSIPLPTSVQVHPLINFGTLLIVGASFFYLSLSAVLSLGMLVVATLMLLGNYYLFILFPDNLLMISIAIFFLSWIGQFIGHKIEGKKPSFFDDLKFLLVGPFWLMGFIYKAIGIKY